ncbi:MAG TPA: hypothetical protein VH740_08500 [Vicinamibacterales bacterium]
MLHAAAIAAALSSGLAAQDRPDLTGTWKLNPELTRQAELRSTEDRAAIAGRRAPLGGGPVSVGSGRSPVGSGGGSGYTGGRANPEDAAKSREAIRIAMLMPDRMTIAREGTGLVVTDAHGVSHTWKMDGKSVRSEVGALTIDTKVKWDGAVLVVERKFEGDVKATDRYAVGGAPRRLTITSKIDANKLPGEGPRTLQRVYDLE